MAEATKHKPIHEKLRLISLGLVAPKSQEGRFGKSRSAEHIMEALKPLLKEHQVTLVQDSEVVDIGGKNYIKATATIISRDIEGHPEQISATAYAWEGEISRGLDAPQVTGAATSYARKYALGGLFTIDDTKDPDAHSEPPEPPKKAPVTASSDDPRPTRSQLDELKAITAELHLDETNTSDFFQDAIGKPRPSTKADFIKSIEFGNTVLKDMNDSTDEALKASKVEGRAS